MRRKKNEVNREKAIGFVDAAEYATISMLDGNIPYAVTVNHVRDGENIYFHCAMQGKKTDLMRANPNVFVSCIGFGEAKKGTFSYIYESANIVGTACEITEQDEKIRVLRLICEKHDLMADNFEEYTLKAIAVTALWKISIEEITGKSNR